MFKKIYVCLFKPTMIGQYMGERFLKSILMLMLVTLMAITPYFVTNLVKPNLRSQSYDYVTENLVNSSILTDIKLTNYQLTGTKRVAIEGFESIICFNPLDEYVYTNSVLVPLTNFGSKVLEVKLGSMVIFSKTYEEMKMTDFDLSKIINRHYDNFDILMSNLNVVFRQVHPLYTFLYSLLTYLSIFVNVLFYGLLIAVFSFLYRPMIPFRIKYKLALDSMAITLFAYFIGFLVNNQYVYIGGLLLSIIYLMISLKRIVAVKVTREE